MATQLHTMTADEFLTMPEDPNDRYSQERAKVDEHLDAGTPMVVLVDPQNRTVSVFHADGGRAELTEDDVLDGGVVPGWSVPVRHLFARPATAS